MKKRLLSLLLTLVLLLGLCPTTAQAKKFTDDPVNDEPYVFTDKDDAVLDNDVFARIDAVTDSIQKSGAELTEQDYINKLPEVIEAIKTSDTYVEGTLMQHGVVLIWETTVGMPCCFDPYMEAKLNGSAEETGTEDPFSEFLSLESLTEKAAKAENDGLPAQADPFGTKAVSNYPSSKEVALIQPYWKSKDNNYDSNFSTYGAKWKETWEKICDDVGSSKDHRYTLTDASIDNVAKAIQECGMVIVNSHGTTDYSDGNGDKYSKANCSYICLKTDSGITTADTKKHAGEFDDYYYVIKAKNYTAVSSGAIVNHMTKDAPHSFVYWGMCLGMTTDGMCAPLLEKGVEAVFGFSRSVSFNGDYGYMYYIFERLREGGDLADAVAHAKENWGNWDPNHGDTFQEALEHPAAFPIVVSSQDAYPGRANVQNYQTVKSNWCLYEPGGRDFLVASDIEDLHLTADPAIPGYHIRIYAKVNGQDANLPTDKLSVYWEASLDGVSWQKVNNSDDQGLIIASTGMIGMWLRAKVFPKDQDDHPFTLITSPIQVVEKLDRLYSPVLPEITRGGTSPSSSVYLKAREGQEYLILTSSAQPTEEDWKNAWHYSSEQTVTLSNTDKPVWNSMNYIWTRFYETDTYNAGEQKKCAKFFWGSASTEELQGTEMEITFAYNHITGDHAEGYWVGDVLKIDAVPIPSRANFEGFAGSSWYYPFLMDQSYGVFYSDLECRNELNADTKYKTVYLHLKKPISEAYISCGPADTGCYTIIEVANDLGHYPVKKVTVPTYSIQIGEVTTRLPFSYTPDKATYNVEHLYVVRDTNVHENGPEGTEPTVIFHANGTMDVDTTPCIEAPYSFRIIDPDTSSVVGKMRVWVGDFDVVPLEGLSFDEPSVSCYAGKSVRVTLRCTPTNGTGLVTWELSNESIATINAPAQIGANYTQAWVKISPDAKSGDLVLVTARSGDYSAICAITVKAPATVTGLPKDVTVKEGDVYRQGYRR